MIQFYMAVHVFDLKIVDASILGKKRIEMLHPIVMTHIKCINEDKNIVKYLQTLRDSRNKNNMRRHIVGIIVLKNITF